MNFIQRALLKFQLTRKAMQDQMDRGREVSRQIQDERLRSKEKKVLEGKPSAVNTVRKHILMRTKNPVVVMKDELSRRKYERDKDD